MGHWSPKIDSRDAEASSDWSRDGLVDFDDLIRPERWARLFRGTTVAGLLARRWGLGVRDTDADVEVAAGKAIGNETAYAEVGAPYFVECLPDLQVDYVIGEGAGEIDQVSDLRMKHPGVETQVKRRETGKTLAERRGEQQAFRPRGDRCLHEGI